MQTSLQRALAPQLGGGRQIPLPARFRPTTRSTGVPAGGRGDSGSSGPGAGLAVGRGPAGRHVHRQAGPSRATTGPLGLAGASTWLLRLRILRAVGRAAAAPKRLPGPCCAQSLLRRAQRSLCRSGPTPAPGAFARSLACSELSLQCSSFDAPSACPKHSTCAASAAVRLGRLDDGSIALEAAEAALSTRSGVSRVHLIDVDAPRARALV